jgi:hypothetical protein
MAAEHDVVDKDYVAADPAVVGDVGRDHDQVVAPHGGHAVVGIAAVKRGVFANAVVVANDETSTRILPLQVLGSPAKNRPFANLIAAAEDGVAFDDDACLQSAAVADDDSGLDNGEGPDADVAPQLRGGIDESRGVDVDHSWVSRGGTILVRRTRGMGQIL